MAVDVYMIDNYDSFTWNVVQYLWELDAAVEVGRNDEVSLDDIEASGSDVLCISPGPCSPDEAGISVPGDSSFQGSFANFWYLPWHAEYWGSFWWANRQSAVGDAWQNK